MQSTGLPPGGRIDFGAPHASRVLDVGSDVQLFCDDFLLTRGAAVSRDYPINIRFTPGTAAKEPAPVMLPGRDAPWETGGIYWVTVLYDGGRFRCWYNTDYVVDRDPRYPHQRPATIAGKVSHQLVAYAESEDGLTWRKPALGMVEVNGSTANNVVLRGDIDRYPGGGCVFIDPTAPTTERYKMLHCGRTPFGLRGAYSADGVAWSMYPWGYNIPGLDTQNVAGYDPVLGRYVAYIRSNSLKRGGRDVGDRPVLPQGWGRAVARIESVRFDGTHPEWSQPAIVLAPDHEDGLDTDFYNCPWSRYRDLHLMFFSPYHHWSGKLDLQLAVSRDNRTWIRPTRMPIVTTSGEPGAYDEFRIYAGPGILPAGPDRVALYTRTGQGPHNGAVDASYTPGDWSTAGLRDGEEPHDGAMSRLTLRPRPLRRHRGRFGAGHLRHAGDLVCRQPAHRQRRAHRSGCGATRAGGGGRPRSASRLTDRVLPAPRRPADRRADLRPLPGSEPGRAGRAGHVGRRRAPGRLGRPSRSGCSSTCVR